MSATMTTQTKIGVPVRLKLRREVARVSDGYYADAEKLAERMARAGLKTDQVRNLENVAYSTDKVSDVLDLVKRQIGRGQWPLDLGEAVLKALRNRRSEAERIAKAVDAADDDLPRRAHLLLCREYVKHLAAHFVYLRGQREGEGEVR